jgi:hypothetical protein
MGRSGRPKRGPNFISAMVGEAVDKKYDGYNLDWESRT